MLFKYSGKYVNIYFNMKITFLCPRSPVHSLSRASFFSFSSGYSVSISRVFFFGPVVAMLFCVPITSFSVATPCFFSRNRFSFIFFGAWLRSLSVFSWE